MSRNPHGVAAGCNPGINKKNPHKNSDECKYQIARNGGDIKERLRHDALGSLND
jgi:hypothetical protein